MVTVVDIAARQGYAVARNIVKDVVAVPNTPCGRGGFVCFATWGLPSSKTLLARDEQAKWERTPENKVGETREQSYLSRWPNPFSPMCGISVEYGCCQTYAVGFG